MRRVLARSVRRGSGSIARVAEEAEANDGMAVGVGVAVIGTGIESIVLIVRESRGDSALFVLAGFRTGLRLS